MTREEVREYFLYMGKIDALINNKLEEKEMLYTLASKTTSSSSDAPGSGAGTSDKVGNIVVKIKELEDEINHLVDDYIDYRAEAILYTSKLPTEQFVIIQMNKIRLIPLTRIAREQKISYQWASELKKRALQGLEGIIDYSELYEKYKKKFKIVDSN